MIQPELDTMHCIIGHPNKPKFLAVRHEEGWSLPTLRFPPEVKDFKAAIINDGIIRKYGLRAQVLRPLLHSPHYHCFELELLAQKPSRKIEAVWVGREQYQQFRSSEDDSPDPFDNWLKEREQGKVSALRLPWQIPGWFEKAESWMQFQLEKLGLQATGGVAQFQAGWSSPCVLSIPSNEGLIYFTAGSDRPPGEVALTVALAEKWPDIVAKPLAFDAKLNWMLNRDFIVSGENDQAPADLSGFVQALAQIQVGSSHYMEEWVSLGCPRHDLDHLLKLIAGKDELMPWLHEGGRKLDGQEMTLLADVLAENADICRKLADYAIPATLVHRNIRYRSLVLQDETPRITHWSDVVIGHPFFSLCRLLVQSESVGTDKVFNPEVISIEGGKAQDISESYLQGFLEFESGDRLREALGLVRQLGPLWRMNQILGDISWSEKGSPRYQSQVALLQITARNMIAAR